MYCSSSYNFCDTFQDNSYDYGYQSETAITLTFKSSPIDFGYNDVKFHVFIVFNPIQGIDIMSYSDTLVKESSKVLWTNNNFKNDYAATTAATAVEVDNYNYYEIIYNVSKSELRWLTTGKISKDRYATRLTDVSATSGSAPTISSRNVYWSTGSTKTTFSFAGGISGKGNTNGAANNGVCIPYQIIGHTTLE